MRMIVILIKCPWYDIYYLFIFICIFLTTSLLMSILLFIYFCLFSLLLETKALLHFLIEKRVTKGLLYDDLSILLAYVCSDTC